MRFFALLLLAVFSPNSAAAQISLQCPSSVDAGAPFEVRWTGTGDSRDFITIVKAGTGEGEYGHYKYAGSGPVELRAPDNPGDYEIRYLGKDGPFPTLSRSALVVTAVTATLDIPATIDAGAPLRIIWQGPDNPQDFITIVTIGTPDREYGIYGYTKKGNPITLRAPDQPGAYEVRYLTGQDYKTLAVAPFTVGATSATLDAPASVAAGAALEVRWTGPDNTQDWIGILPAGSTAKNFLNYRYTKRGSPAQLVAPDEPGRYEIVYATGQDSVVLERVEVEVLATSASLSAPESVPGGQPFTVEWTGPDNPRDYISMVPAKSSKRARSAAYSYTYEGNPGTLRAPLEAGAYLLRYETGSSAKVLATRPILVTPATAGTGSLRVLSHGGGTSLGLQSADGVELILDASGSMLQRQNGRRRIEIAKETLQQLIAETIPAGTNFALRVFGHRERESCRTDLEIALAPLDADRAARIIGGLEAMNLAKTPIARSLDLVADDLAEVQGERVIVLVTDGEETCDGDPAKSIESLRSGGHDVRVNIVGFNIDDEDLRQTFRFWASVGGGTYHDASDASGLGVSLTKAVRAPFDVVDSKGRVVGEGLVGGEAVSIPAGSYTVRTRTHQPKEVEAVVDRDRETVVTFSG